MRLQKSNMMNDTCAMSQIQVSIIKRREKPDDILRGKRKKVNQKRYGNKTRDLSKTSLSFEIQSSTLVNHVDGFAAVIRGGCDAAALLSTFENHVAAKEKSLFRHYGLRRWTPVTHNKGSSRAIHPMDFCHVVIFVRVLRATLAFEPE